MPTVEGHTRQDGPGMSDPSPRSFCCRVAPLLELGKAFQGYSSEQKQPSCYLLLCPGHAGTWTCGAQPPLHPWAGGPWGFCSPSSRRLDHSGSSDIFLGFCVGVSITGSQLGCFPRYPGIPGSRYEDALLVGSSFLPV